MILIQRNQNSFAYILKFVIKVFNNRQEGKNALLNKKQQQNSYWSQSQKNKKKMRNKLNDGTQV